MKAFWYSSDSIWDSTTDARLRLAFEDVVVPDRAAEGYYPHSELILPRMDNSEFASISTFDALRDFESWQTPVALPIGRSPVVERMQEYYELRYKCFLNYVRVASLNDGVLVGEGTNIDSELITCLNDPLFIDPNAQKVKIAQALLSLASIRIALPQIDPVHIDVLLEAKRKYSAEVSDYQAYLAELLGGVWDVVKADPTYDELVKWMNFVAHTKVAPALQRVESAIRTGDRTLCERIGYSAMTELPSLVSGQLKGDHLSLVSGALSSLLSVLAPNLAQSIRERRTLESAFGLSYLYKLKRGNE